MAEQRWENVCNYLKKAHVLEQTDPAKKKDETVGRWKLTLALKAPGFIFFAMKRIAVLSI